MIVVPDRHSLCISGALTGGFFLVYSSNCTKSSFLAGGSTGMGYSVEWEHGGMVHKDMSNLGGLKQGTARAQWVIG